jgi:uncharacterized protein (UPF0332 family)
MERIRWCLEKMNGIKLIHPNIKTSSEYMVRAKLDFQNINNQNPIWKVIVAYYACYNAFYAVLQRYGIKSEIRACTIEMLKYFAELEPFQEFIKELRDNRQNTQYYLKDPKDIDIIKVEEFINKCDKGVERCNNDKISALHKMLSQT